MDQDWLVDTERERHRLNYHLLRAQGNCTPAGALLSGSIVAVQTERHFDRLPSMSGRLARERLLSMLTVFLGRESMRELDLPLRPPWAHPVAVLANTWRYRIAGRTRWGRRRLDRWGHRTRERVLRSYYGPGSGERSVGELPGPVS